MLNFIHTFLNPFQRHLVVNIPLPRIPDELVCVDVFTSLRHDNSPFIGKPCFLKGSQEKKPKKYPTFFKPLRSLNSKYLPLPHFSSFLFLNKPSNAYRFRL